MGKRVHDYANPIWYCALKSEITTIDSEGRYRPAVIDSVCEKTRPDCRKCGYRKVFINMINTLEGVIPEVN